MTKTLIEKIEALPAEKVAKVEELVDALSTRPSEGTAVAADGTRAERFPQALLNTIDEHRERMRRERGLLDSVPIIRDLRESGD